MQLVETKQGIDLRDVAVEKCGTFRFWHTSFKAFLCCLYPLGGFVLLINAYLHFSREYAMCFLPNGMSAECFKQLNTDELIAEKKTAFLYFAFFLIFRALPILCIALA